MNIMKFREYLQNKGQPLDEIKNTIEILKEFERFLKSSKKSFDTLNTEDFHEFSTLLIDNEENTYENYGSLLQYGYFTGKKELNNAGQQIKSWMRA